MTYTSLPPVIIQNNHRLHSCMLCHQYKPYEEMVFRRGFNYCCDCNTQSIERGDKTTEPLITILPKLFLPPIEDFNTFMDDVIFYNSGVVPALKDYILTLTDQKTMKSISIDTTALLQILCDKYSHPAIHESYKIIIPVDLEIKMHNLYTDIQDKLEHAILKYNKIMILEDARIKDMVLDYSRLHEIPLTLKLEYQNWEKQLTSGYIAREVARQMRDKEREVDDIRRKYSEDTDKEKIKNKTAFSNYKEKINKLEMSIETVNNLKKNEVEKRVMLENERDELYTKLKKLETDLSAKEVELSKAKFELGKLQKQAEKQKSEEWVLDQTSTQEEPVYINQITGEIVKYPPDFKETYKPIIVDVDNSTIIYRKKDGDEEFKVPRTLSRLVSSSCNVVENGNIITKPIEKLTENDVKVLNALSRDKEEAKTIGELHVITGVAASHISSSHLKKLVEQNMVAKFKDDGNVLRFYRI